MFNAPPRTSIKTRSAIAREKLNRSDCTDDTHHETQKQESEKMEQKNELYGTTEQLPRREGSLKIETGDTYQSYDAPSKKVSSSKVSLSARRKQLELEAAEEKAKIEKDLIEKRLAADLAALESGSSSSSLYDKGESLSASNKVEEWLDKSDQDKQRAATVLPPPPAPPLNNIPTAGVEYLARAIEHLATATHASNTQLLSRLATTKDLPPFSGEPLEWLQFKKAFEESTKLCTYSDGENVARLNRCLRGEAREAVSALLISDTPPKVIIEALELRFGRPELLIHQIASQFRKLPGLPPAYHTEIVSFAIKVKNYVAAAQSLNQADYLRSPDLLNSVVSKCPSALIDKWVDYLYEHENTSMAKLQIFAEFLHREATKVAAAGISHLPTPTAQQDHKPPKRYEDRKILFHSVINNNSDQSANCKLCRTVSHPLTNCNKFKRALRKDRWRIVTINKLCHKCLMAGHSKENCPAAPCDIDECGMAHHQLLHWPARRNASSSHRDNTQNDTTTATNLATTNESEIVNNISTEGTVANNTYSEATSRANVMLKIVSVNIHGPQGVIKTHALLDDGASVTLVSADLADILNIRGQAETLRIRGAWNSEIVCQSEVVKFKISNNNKQSFEVRARKISELDLPVQKLSIVNIDFYEHLRNLKEHLCVSDVKPKLLIGQDNFELLLSLKIIHRGKNEPCATLTPLGWCLHGIAPANAGGPLLTTELALHTVISEPADRRAQPLARAAAAGPETHTYATEAMQQACDAHIDDNLYELVRRSFAFEAIGVTLKPRINKDEIRAIEKIDNSRLIDGRWEVSLPWKDDSSRMPDSYPNAYKRFLTVEKKMSSNENFAARYKDRVRHLFENDYARPVTEEEMAKPQNHEWYLPHFGVNNENKNKLRLVFDARAPTAGRSLNDFLIQGPDLLQSLLGIMLRFREKPVAIMGDIRDMFLRIKIKNEDQHALRFLWRENDKAEMKTYAMTSLIFGANCSPFIAQFIKNKNASRFEQSMPEAAEAVQKSHYMDDYIDSVDDVQTAIKMVKEVTEIHQQGGFEIRNWSSNKKEVLDSTRKEALSDKAIRLKTGCDDLPERTLGLLWFPSSDTFGFDLSLKRIPPEITDFQRKPTKRELLRIFMSIFDIFGFLAPFTVKGKIILQNTWKSEIKWDDVITEKDEVIFKEWMTTLKKLQHLRIPRYLFHPTSRESEIDGASVSQRHSADAACETETTIELHMFCDAAPTAYACVGYWRKITSNGSVCTSFIACKCRAAPIKKYTTVAKLELQSAVIACRLADTIQRESRVKPEKRYFWTDSMIVLHQIKNTTRKHNNVFVANRLGEIDELSRSNEWHYVPTELNIADKATKLNTYELSSDCEWFRGPQFLYSPVDCWPTYESGKEEESDYALHVNIINTEQDIDLPVPDATRFASWLRLLRCEATVLLFIKRCRGARTAEMDGEMIRRAETEILKKSQMQSFAKEMYLLKNGKPVEASSRLSKLTPYLDESGLLRVGGRIDAALGVDAELKRPVIIDGRHPTAVLLIKHFHVQAAHGSNETIINEIRQKFWLVRLRPTVRAVASRCLVCRIRKAKPATPRMGDLPAARLAHHQRPFTHCGVDLFGPMIVTVGRRHEDRYGVLFTCLTTRAIHIEIVPSLSADSFIMALRRMAARRGWPFRMYSDNGTNFRGAQKELQKSFQEISKSNINNDLINKGVEWHFISPVSPWMGGCWERQIRTVKTSLKIILKERAPREEVLMTLLIEVENMVNSRPLSHVSVDHEDPESLTPNHFLIGSSSNLPVPGVFDDRDLYRKKLWRKAQRLADMFWCRWVREVLPTLLPRSKWHQEERNLKVGDIVVIVDPASPRNTWPKGLIEKVHPGADGRVRIVDVRTKTGVLTRPVARLAPLPSAEDDDDDCPERSMGGRM